MSSDHVDMTQAAEDLREDVRLEFLTKVVEIIDAEPELPGEIPKELRAMLITALVRGDENVLVECLRLMVRLTKEGIKRRTIMEFAPEGSLAKRFGILHGQCFRWTGDGTGEIVWAIEAAREIIGNRPPQVVMKPEHVLMALAQNPQSNEIDEAYAMTKDLSIPLIAVPSPSQIDIPGAMVLIDGWHRLKKAALTNHQEPLHVHLLSREEEMMCRIEQMQ